MTMFKLIRNEYIFRFANILKHSSVKNIQSVVKAIKSQATLDLDCDSDDQFIDKVKLSQVEAVEQLLQIESSEQINETLTNEELQTAAEMFIYLNSCPTKWSKSWSSFYKDLFLSLPADQIILTLNRMMKTKRSEEDKLRAKKLMRRTSNLLSLNFERIQSLLPDTYRNASVKVLEGAQFNNL